ncbi:MAG: cysteine desulfurase family protein [Alphaproteobacteria bacterium]|nr:cysteine desulfurase family protein [Alphaproteobacteria bacterium]
MNTTSRIYLDNAATTPLDPEVLDAMLPYLKDHFGNPSSIYSYGREAKMGIEKARKQVAQLVGCTPNEIVFTSGGTESINTAIYTSVNYLNCNHIITTKIEHHATLHSVQYCEQKEHIKVSYLHLNELGQINYDELETLLKLPNTKTLVCLMHANNEIGNLLKIKKVSELVQAYNAYFLCDTVQTIGHYPIQFTDHLVDFAICAPHKFHGPKGVGFLLVNNRVNFPAFIQGGAQERNHRGGTENVYGIVGLAKALEKALNNYESYSAHVLELKTYCYQELKQNFEFLHFNGTLFENNLYTLLNFSVPDEHKAELLIYNLDMNQICISSGSACSSGSSIGSHVIAEIKPSYKGHHFRISFSHLNTKSEIDSLITTLKKFI